MSPGIRKFASSNSVQGRALLMASDSVDSVDRGRISAPAPVAAHKLLGNLNIVFASILLLCGACSGASAILQIAMAPMSAGYQKAMQEAMHAQVLQEHQQKIDSLQKLEDAETDPLIKAQFTVQRQTLEQTPPPVVDFPDMTKLYQDAYLVAFMAADFSTGLVLNGMLLASGIGLLAAKRWGRRLGLWVASLKIARLVALYGFAIAVVIPGIAKAMGEMVEAMMKQTPRPPGQPPLPPMGQTFAMVYGVGLSAGAILMILCGAIYPAVMLWVLTRPGVKTACGDSLSAAEAS